MMSRLGGMDRTLLTELDIFLDLRFYKQFAPNGANEILGK